MSRCDLLEHLRQSHPSVSPGRYEDLFSISDTEKLGMREIWERRHAAKKHLTKSKATGSSLQISEAHSSQMVPRCDAPFILICLRLIVSQIKRTATLEAGELDPELADASEHIDGDGHYMDIDTLGDVEMMEGLLNDDEGMRTGHAGHLNFQLTMFSCSSRAGYGRPSQ